MHLTTLQYLVNTRWSKQLNNPCHSSADPPHALLHILKAAGKLATIVNDAQHSKKKIRAKQVDRYLADLVICAARFAGDSVDLEDACIKRIKEKFPKG